MNIHILRTLTKDSDGHWHAACSCGSCATNASKVEAVNLHRNHIAEARKAAAA